MSEAELSCSSRAYILHALIGLGVTPRTTSVTDGVAVTMLGTKMSTTNSLAMFLEWLGTHCDRGERLIQGDLSDPPRWFFEQNSNGYAEDFFARIDKWSAWRLELIAGLRRRLIDADHLVSAAEEHFTSDRLLRFGIRLAQDSRKRIGVDLRERDWYLDSTGWTTVRALLARGREEPAWNTVRQNILIDIRRFKKMVTEQQAELVLAGEPRSLTLNDALTRFAALTYIDDSLVKTDILAAEQHLRSGHAKDVGSAFRRAIEQVIKDSYLEAMTRSGTAVPSPLPSALDQARMVGRILATKASGYHAYGAYALMSELGAHSGPFDPDELDATWHTAVAALLILAKRLKS